jgi:hypothetical protein
MARETEVWGGGVGVGWGLGEPRTFAFDDLSNLRLKTHVQHAVRLVQDEPAGRAASPQAHDSGQGDASMDGQRRVMGVHQRPLSCL